jgi:hypothetical protein
MIRTLDWRDLAVLHRMRSQGLCLDSKLDCTRGPDAFHDALLDPFSRRRSTYTLIDRSDDNDQAISVGQFTHHSEQVFAHLTFLGPTDALSQPSGMNLIEALSQAAGSQKIQHLIAEIDENSPAFENLRRAGFAVYARQRIWQQTGPTSLNMEKTNLEWRPECESDVSAIRNLYHNLVPGLVQQVETPPSSNDRNLVYWHHNELLAYLDLKGGSRGIWAQAYIHPAMERTQDLLTGLLAHLEFTSKKPIYFCVRSYQAGLNFGLQGLGFQPCSDQAVMVKRLTAMIRNRVPTTLRAIEGTQPEPTAPIARSASSAQAVAEIPIQKQLDSNTVRS